VIGVGHRSASGRDRATNNREMHIATSPSTNARTTATPAGWTATGTLPWMRARTSSDDVEDAFVAGDRDALRRVFDLHQRAVHSYCRRFLPEQAADVTQEVFLAAWRSRQRFDPATGSLAGWLMGIARFKVIDELRRSYRTDSVASGDLTERAQLEGRRPSDDPAIDLMATRILVSEALQRLDEPGCSWIRMAFMEGLAHSEIADRTGVPLGTVKSTIRRGLARMRRDLEAFDADV